MLRQLAVRGLLQEADAMNGQQRWRMLPAVRRAVENILRPGSGGNSGSSDTSGPEWPALVHLLASSTAAAHRLFHDRAAGWVGAALFEAVAPLAAPIAAWLATPGSMPNSVRNELLQVRWLHAQRCGALLCCCPTGNPLWRRSALNTLTCFYLMS